MGAVALLPTPSAADGLGGHESRGGARGHERLLAGIAKDLALLPTPTGDGANNDTRASGSFQSLARETYGRTDFGPYDAAVARWEAVLGRRAPSPTEPGRDGRPRLSPAFVEWMMGLLAGHVTDPAIGLTRAQQLKALGNGVVPQQAALALRLLLSSPAGGVTCPDPARSAGVGASPLLPTPEAHESGSTPESHLARKPGRTKVTALNIVVEHLLPTPAVNDMGEGKTVERWDEWTADMKTLHGNGNGHGRSLAIEAQRLGGGDELA